MTEKTHAPHRTHHESSLIMHLRQNLTFRHKVVHHLARLLQLCVSTVRANIVVQLPMLLSYVAFHSFGRELPSFRPTMFEAYRLGSVASLNVLEEPIA